MNRLVVRGHARLLECLTKGGVGVARPGDILARGSVFHGKNHLCDHFARVGPENMGAKNPVCFLVAEDLDHSLLVTYARGTAVG